VGGVRPSGIGAQPRILSAGSRRFTTCRTVPPPTLRSAALRDGRVGAGDTTLLMPCPLSRRYSEGAPPRPKGSNRGGVAPETDLHPSVQVPRSEWLHKPRN